MEDRGGFGMPQPQPGARPMVDPEASGEVDLNMYPEAKESTHKIRGKTDFLERIFGPIHQELLVMKCFYFFFYSAFGSLFPLMGVYFKQMGMNATQCGFLIGARPFVEFLSAPFWGSLADRWHKGKLMLLASLSAWIIFTVPLGSIQPPATSCLLMKNNTPYLSAPDFGIRIVDKRSVTDEEQILANVDHQPNIYSHLRERRAAKLVLHAGQSPINVGYASNYNPIDHESWVQPIISSIVYRTEDIQKAFFLLFLLVIIGEFFSAPAITLADSAVITLLGDDADLYGQQRMFGSLGWGIAMFFVGIGLDNSTAFPNHPCGPEGHEKNYTICFATFSVLMGAALITATQITFKYATDDDVDGTSGASMTARHDGQIQEIPLSREDQMQAQLAEQLQLPSLANIRAQPADPLPFKVGDEKTTFFAHTTRKIPEWMTVLHHFNNLKCASILFVAWFMGFGIGLIFTFLFWHLQDFGGSPTLFGIASVINHISEICAYFFSFRLIRQYGHVKVLCFGLLLNTLRFLYISWLTNPWWVLPFEFMQGVTHAAVWAACCSYIAHNSPAALRISSQGVLQGIHHGLGRGCGAVIGGILVNQFGSTVTFRAYGVVCLLVLGGFIFINFYRGGQGFVSDLPQTEDPRDVAEESAHLAPHGVPSNPLPRALSSSKLQDMESAAQKNNDASYGTYQGGTLGVPGAQGYNPFAQQGSDSAGGFR